MQILMSLFGLTAVGVIIYDYKYQMIPIWLILLNYILISCICNYWLLLGIIPILILYKLDKPIDVIYVLNMLYLIIRVNNIQSTVICVLITLLFILFQRQDKISFMIPLELSILVQITNNFI